MGFYRFQKQEQSGQLKASLDNNSTNFVERLTSYGGNPPVSIVRAMFPIYRVGMAAVCFGHWVREDTRVVEQDNNPSNQYLYVSAADRQTERDTISFLEKAVSLPIKLTKVPDKLIKKKNVR